MSVWMFLVIPEQERLVGPNSHSVPDPKPRGVFSVQTIFVAAKMLCGENGREEGPHNCRREGHVLREL